MPSPDSSSVRTPPRWLRALPLVELTVLLAAGLAALAFHARLPSQLADDRSYAEVGHVLESEVQPGDVLLLFPWWTEQARLYAPERLPVVGYLGSDEAALTRHPRIWVLAQPRLPRADWAGFLERFGRERTALGPPRSFGNLRLWLYRNDRHRPVRFSVVDAFATAQVYLEAPNGERMDCPFQAGAHRCPRGSLMVQPQWHELNAEPRRCLWLKPPGGPTRLVVELAEVPAGALSLEGGVIWEHAPRKDPGLTAVRFGVERAGASVAQVSVPPGLEGVQTARADLSAPGPLRLWSQADNPEHRDLCVDLFVYGEGEAR